MEIYIYSSRGGERWGPLNDEKTEEKYGPEIRLANNEARTFTRRKWNANRGYDFAFLKVFVTRLPGPDDKDVET